MAEPIRFPYANSTWTGPECGDLPAYSGDGMVISCWKLSLPERLYALFKGKVWLTVWGREQPVNIMASEPFTTKGDRNAS